MTTQGIPGNQYCGISSNIKPNNNNILIDLARIIAAPVFFVIGGISDVFRALKNNFYNLCPFWKGKKITVITSTGNGDNPQSDPKIENSFICIPAYMTIPGAIPRDLESKNDASPAEESEFTSSLNEDRFCPNFYDDTEEANVCLQKWREAMLNRPEQKETPPASQTPVRNETPRPRYRPKILAEPKNTIDAGSVFDPLNTNPPTD